MTESSNPMEPEIAQLIAEISANPSSLLLRVPVSTTRCTAYDLESGLSACASGLIPAEREILEVWRAEVAELFRQAFNRRLLFDPTTKEAVLPLDQQNRLFEPCTAQQTADKAAALRTNLSVQTWTAPIDTLLIKLSSESSAHPPTLEALATWSLRIRPSDEARLCLAVAAGIARDWARCFRILSSILERSSDRQMRAWALTNFEWGLESLDLDAKRVEAAQEMEKFAPGWAIPYLKQLVVFLHLGDATRARRAAECLMALGAEADLTIDLHLGLRRRQSISGRWHPSPPFRRTVGSIPGELGARLERFIDACS